MLEALAAVRNNNNRKIKDPDYDPGAIEHSKRVLKGLLKKGNQSAAIYNSKLKFSAIL